MNEVRLSDETRSDLAEIWLYIAQDSPSAADRQLRKFLGPIRDFGSFSRNGAGL